MSEKWKQKILLIFPFAVLAAGMIFTATFFLHTYRQIAFEHTSALCETILANSPEAEPQLLAALKDYHSLTEQELRGNDYLEKYGYRVDDGVKLIQKLLQRKHVFIIQDMYTLCKARILCTDILIAWIITRSVRISALRKADAFKGG